MSVSVTSPPPTGLDASWYVASGQMVVGPVSTELLLRGITHRRIPLDCMVKQPSWSSWRGLSEIRETRPLREDPTFLRGSSCEVSQLLASARDSSEALSVALGLAASRTSAHVGIVHRVRRGSRVLSPVACLGLVPDEALATKLDPLDPAVQHANDGLCAFGAPRDTASTRSTSSRIGGSVLLAGVLMIPIRDRGRLLAMIELGRYDHTFRAGDGRRATALSMLVATHLARD